MEDIILELCKKLLLNYKYFKYRHYSYWNYKFQHAEHIRTTYNSHYNRKQCTGYVCTNGLTAFMDTQKAMHGSRENIIM